MLQDTYIGAVRDGFAEDADRPLFTFLADGTGEGVTWTPRDLHREASQVARLLRDSLAPGDRVLIMAAPGLDYLAAFFGCLYAGVIAVPAYPPTTLNARNGLERIYAIMQDAQVAAVLADGAVSSALAPYSGLVPQLLLTVDQARLVGDHSMGEDTDLDDVGRDARPDDIAFLQYTSGSTGEPKGVMVTQRNLITNITMLARAYTRGPGDTLVSWLPPYHDMGLIGKLLPSPVLGTRTVFMPPTAFLRQPARWLQVISRFRGTISAAPNFAYETCIRKVKDVDLEGLDLSTWRVAINGAEPVRASTLETFAERFGPSGFRGEAMHPAYGLAETTLMTATAPWGAGASIVDVDATAIAGGVLEAATGPDSRRLVTCGRLPAGTEVTVIDPETGSRLGEGQVGELVVRGPHVARGYWGRDTDGRFSGDSVRTGDLGGFVGGDLVVTGRVKDLIVIRGRNHYSHDIERTAEQAHPGLRPGCGAAFSVDLEGEERLVVVHEVTPGQLGEPSSAVDAVRRGITVAHGIAPDAVVLVAPGGVAKTSSGKVRRTETRRLYLSGELTPLFVWRSVGLVVGDDAGVPATGSPSPVH